MFNIKALEDRLILTFFLKDKHNENILLSDKTEMSITYKVDSSFDDKVREIALRQEKEGFDNTLITEWVNIFASACIDWNIEGEDQETIECTKENVMHLFKQYSFLLHESIEHYNTHLQKKTPPKHSS